MPSYPPPARRCLDLAAAAAPAMVGRAIDQAVAAMQEDELQSPEVRHRQELAQAWLALLQHRDDWVQRFPPLLHAAQEAVAAQAPALPAGGPGGALSLVDDQAITRSIEAARLTQLLGPRLEQPLAELDALMSAALGLATVQPERNPLRPDVFAQALRGLMHAPDHPQRASLWTRHLAAPLGDEIAKLYADVLQLLQDANLRAASYRVLPVASALAPAAPAPTPGPGGGAGGGEAGSGGGAGSDTGPAGGAGGTGEGASGATGPGVLGGAAWADLSRYELGDELFQHFLFARTGPSAQGLAPAYYAHVERELAEVEAAEEAPYDPQAAQRHRDLAPVERPHRPVGTASPLDDAQWGRWGPARERALLRTRLKKEARQVAQVMGLEVVRKLVDQVARDPRLLAPVREAIVAVEPALLRLALLAPRFFSHEDHAARRLVERVAERSFRYNDEFASEFQAFFSDVRATFQGLNETAIEGDQPFAAALARLEEQWEGEDALESPGRQVAQAAMYFAEAREAEAGQIAWSLSQRADLEGVPAVVQDFLYGPWSLVMAHARLTGGQRQIDPGGWNGVVSDLLWSVKSEQTLRDPARLIATIPGMLEQLRSGLALLGQDPQEVDTFFQSLEQLHRPVLKLRARQRRSGQRPDGGAALDPALLATERLQPGPGTGQPWMAREELRQAGFEEPPASGAAPLAADAEPAPAAQPEPAPALLGEGEVGAVVAGLHQGCWADLHARGRWRRAELTWVNPRATLFMFVSNGGQPHSMTRRTLERLLRGRLLRPLEHGAVVQRAIDELSQRRVRPQRLAA